MAKRSKSTRGLFAMATRAWLFPPSAWGLLAGAVLGIALNIVTTLKTDADHSTDHLGLLVCAILNLLLSAGGFGTVTSMLEELRSNPMARTDLKVALESETTRRRLFPATAAAVGGLSLGLIFYFVA